MIYSCKDCSYRGKRSGQDGSCLACGSFNLSRTPTQEEEPVKSGKLRVGLLIGLWAYLIGLIIWKLNP
jgi:hypothetical protein